MSFSHILKKISNFPGILYYRYVTTSHNIKTSCKSAVANIRPQLLFLICYSLGWITGLIALRMQNLHAAVRFHAWQSIVTSATLSVILIVPLVVMKFVTVPSLTLAWALVGIYCLIIAFAICLWVLLMYKSYRSGIYKLCIAGDIAWRLSRAGEGRVFANTINKLPAPVIKETPVVLKYPALEQQIPQKFEVSPGIWQEIVNAIATLYKNRDPYTTSHQERVAQLACAIAKEMSFPEDRIEGIQIMGVIHDIGKIAVPGEILSKSGKLNDYELGIIKTHPEVAFNILKRLQFPWPVALAIFQHHERLDGSGYPAGISGDEILPETRILSVSDVVEAMATHRPYRPALGIKEAMHEITRKRGILYDPDVVDACIALFTEKGFTWNILDNTKLLMNVTMEVPCSIGESI